MSIDNHNNKEKLKAQSGAKTGAETGAETRTETGAETGAETRTETGAKKGAETGAETGAKTGAKTVAKTETQSGAQPVVMENSASLSEPRPSTIETSKTDEEKIFDLALTTYRMRLVRKICRSEEQNSKKPQDIQKLFSATKNLDLEKKKFILNWFTEGQENINGENFNEGEGKINLGMGDSPNSNDLTQKTINKTKEKYNFLLEGDFSKKHFLYIEEFCQNIISDGSADFTKKISALKQISSTVLSDDDTAIYKNKAYKAHLETTIGSTNLGALSEEAKTKIKTQSSSFLALASVEDVSFFSDLTITKPGGHPALPRKEISNRASSKQ